VVGLVPASDARDDEHEEASHFVQGNTGPSSRSRSVSGA
jgi:hypothetical protein